MLSELAGFLVTVSIGCEFKTFEEIDPLTGQKRPEVSEWDGFPGASNSICVGFKAPNTKLGPASAVGIFSMSSGKMGLRIAAKGTNSPERAGADAWYPISYSDVKLVRMLAPSVTARAFSDTLPPPDVLPGQLAASAQSNFEGELRLVTWLVFEPFYYFRVY